MNIHTITEHYGLTAKAVEIKNPREPYLTGSFYSISKDDERVGVIRVYHDSVVIISVEHDADMSDSLLLHTLAMDATRQLRKENES